MPHNRRILLVEDNADGRLFLSDLFTQAGYAVTTAEDGTGCVPRSTARAVADATFTKPFDSRQMLDTLRMLIRRAEDAKAVV